MSTPLPLIPFKLIKTLISKNIAAVVIHDRGFLPLHYIIKAFQKKTVFLCHNIFQNKNSLFRLFRNINYISVSESAKKGLLAASVPSEKISVISNGIATPTYANSFSDFSAATNYIFEQRTTKTIKILYVGRLSIEKGIYTLLDSLNSTTLRNKNIELVVIGPMNEKFKLHFDTIDDETKSKISLIGNVENPFEHIHTYRAHLIVIPSHYEGFGLVMAEALSAGLKIVASDIAPFREISNSPTVTYSKANCADSLAKMIAQSIESEPSIEETWKESKRITSKFSQKMMYENYDRYFEDI